MYIISKEPRWLCSRPWHITVSYIQGIARLAHKKGLVVVIRPGLDKAKTRWLKFKSFGNAEETKLTLEEEEAEAGVQRVTQSTESAIWRLTDGQGDADRIASSRSAKGRLDFVLQVKTSGHSYLMPSRNISNDSLRLWSSRSVAVQACPWTHLVLPHPKSFV